MGDYIQKQKTFQLNKKKYLFRVYFVFVVKLKIHWETPAELQNLTIFMK